MNDGLIAGLISFALLLLISWVWNKALPHLVHFLTSLPTVHDRPREQACTSIVLDDEIIDGEVMDEGIVLYG